MLVVQLLTSTGAHVAFVEILRYATAPNVVTWGSRVFVQHPSRAFEYVEAFAVTSLTPSPGLVRSGAV